MRLLLLSIKNQLHNLYAADFSVNKVINVEYTYKQYGKILHWIVLEDYLITDGMGEPIGYGDINADKTVDLTDLSMSKQMNYYSIYIENSISNEILKDNPNLITTKNDKSIHGLGTKSIENIVNSYQGLFEYVEENGKFICNILLKDIENK